MALIKTEARNSTAPGRNPGIDFLRGLSIVLVVAHHIGLRIPLKQGILGSFIAKRWLSALIYNGYEAVFIFFVISGFLITSNALSRWVKLSNIDIKAFYARRASRIVPCLLILVAVLSVLHLMGVERYVINRAGQSLPRAIVSALGLHLNWYEGRTGYLPGNWDVLWSLSIEEVFYLCFPLLCLGLRKQSLLVTALILLALSLPASRAALASNEIWQEKAYLPGMAGIAMGVLGALIAASVRPKKQITPAVLSVIGALGILSVLCLEDVLWNWIGNGAMLVLTSSAMMLVVAFHWQATNFKPWEIPGTGWLRSFGRLSYEVYLTHMFVVWPVIGAFKSGVIDAQWGFVWYLPGLALAWMLGWVVARFISIPCERILRRRLTQTERDPEPPLDSPTTDQTACGIAG